MEQAIAAWITHLNQMRLDTLIEKLNRQDINLEEALKELEKIKQFIGDPAHILGSVTTKHGEIAEHMQVNFENALQSDPGISIKIIRLMVLEGLHRKITSGMDSKSNPSFIMG